MFECNKTLFGKHQRYQLFNAVTKTGFSVVPTCGALMLDLTFNGVNVLDAYTKGEDLEKLDWMKNTILYPFPNRLKDGKYTWQGKTHQFEINNQETGNALHGFALYQSFKITRIVLTEDTAAITCRLENIGNTAGYPYPTTLDVTFSIGNNNKFRVAFEVRNLHSESIPVGLGWHPYFKLTENVGTTTLKMPICEKVEIDARMLPTGNTTDFNTFQSPKKVGKEFLDNGFKVKTKGSFYKIAINGDGKKISLQANSEVWPYLQVFTPPYRGSIAIEPMTCNIDAFNNQNGLITLEAGKSWKGEFTVNG
jgi:aldose 1-epimerase